MKSKIWYAAALFLISALCHLSILFYSHIDANETIELHVIVCEGAAYEIPIPSNVSLAKYAEFYCNEIITQE